MVIFHNQPVHELVLYIGPLNPCHSINSRLAYVLEQHALQDHCDCGELCCVRSLCVVNVKKVTALSKSAKLSA